MKNELKWGISLIVFVSVAISAYWYLFGGFLTSANADAVSLVADDIPEYAPTGTCSQCIALDYHKEMYPSVWQTMSIHIFANEIQKKNITGKLHLSIQSDTTSGSGLKFSLNEDNLSSQYAPESSRSIDVPTPLQSDSVVNINAKGPDEPGIQYANLKVTDDNNEVIYEKKIAIYQKPLYIYKVTRPVQLFTNEQGQIVINKTKLDKSAISQVGYKIVLNNSEGTELYYIGNDSKPKKAQRIFDEKGSYLEDDMPVMDLSAPQTSINSMFLIVSKEPKDITVTIYDLLNSKNSPIAKRTISIEEKQVKN